MHIKTKRRKDLEKQLDIVNTSINFDSKWYLEQYPDVAKDGINPAKHYLKYGWKEGRNPSVFFDTNKYLKEHPNCKICPVIDIELYKEFPNFEIVKPGFRDKIYHFLKREKIFISIIVASYNYQDYIQKTLKSLFQQTYKNYEIIIVDDGSTDNSVDVINRIIKDHKNAFLYRHPNGENRGLPATVKLGIEKAKGDYIAFCESDDIWTEDHLAKKVKIIQQYANPKIIVNAVEPFGDYVRMCKLKQVLKDIYTKISCNKLKVTYSMIRSQQWIPTFSCCMVKKSVLKKCDFSAGGRPSALDWWLWRQILPKCTLFYMTEKLTYWRIHNSYNSTQHEDSLINQVLFNQKSDTLFCGRYIPIEYDDKIKVLQESNLFNYLWYQRTYNLSAEVDPYYHYFYKGWLLGYNPSEYFDGNKYLDFYNDVREAEMNPLYHYIRYSKGRFYVNPMCFSELDILILTTVSLNDGVYKWRCLFMKNFIEQALNCQVSVESIIEPTEDILSKVAHAKLIIFNRPNNQAFSMQILSFILKNNKKTIMDMDDIVAQNYQNFSGRFLSKQITWEALSYNTFVQESCLDYFDKIIVSTSMLKSIHSRNNRQVMLYPNKIDPEIIPISEKMPSKRLRLLYASGSITHDHDFRECYLDLLNFMLKHPDVDLTILGDTNASFDFEVLKERVVKISKVTYEEMLDIYSKHDLLLIPLKENVFNQCKSNIKYIEAASVKTAVLAKDIDEFNSVINDGQNGFLYRDNFYEKLEEIYDKKDTLNDIGLAAYNDCIKFRTTQYMDDCSDFIKLIREIIDVKN